MAHGGRHLAQRGQFLALGEALFGLLERALDPLALGDFPLQPPVQPAKALPTFARQADRLQPRAATSARKIRPPATRRIP